MSELPALTHIQHLELLVQDGLATPEQEAELRESGVDPDQGRLLRAAIAIAFGEVRHGGADSVDGMAQSELAASVLTDLGLDDEVEVVRALLLEEVDAVEPPDLVPDVMAALALDDGWAGVADALHSALSVDEVPDLSVPVMAEITGELPDLGTLLRDAAGDAPDLWGAIAGELGIEDRVEALAPAPENVVRLRPWERWTLPGIGMAAAAALLLVFSGTPAPEGGELAWDLSPVNHVDIEELLTDGNAMVQVLQFDEDAPPIIFVNEGFDDEWPEDDEVPL